MDKQKALIQSFLTALGLDDTDAVISSLFPSDDKTEPSLDIDTLLSHAQEYSKPFLKEHFEKELQPHFKKKYEKELLSKLAQSSNGLLKTTEAQELGDIKKATDLLAQRIKESVGKSDADKDKMIEELNATVEQLKTEHQSEIQNLRAEYETREERRNTHIAALDYFSKKTLAVSPQIATKGVLAALEEKFVVKFNPDTKTFDLYDKADPTKRAKKSATAFASFEEESENIIKDYNWVAKSKGGGGKSKEEGTGSSNTGGTGNEPPARKSKLGAVYERASERSE